MRDIINITMGELTTAVDNEVMKAVQKVGIDVDKEELLKALELYHNLVRCKECSWAEETKFTNCEGDTVYMKTCPVRKGIINDNDFCSYGEREGE